MNANSDAPESVAASTSDDRQGQDWNSKALAADHAVRSGVDRLRPGTERLGQAISPYVARVWNWLAPLIERIQRSAAYERLCAMSAPVGEWIRTRSGSEARHATDRPSSRLRTMRLGAGVAAVGVLGIIFGVVGGAGGGQSVNTASQVAPFSSEPTPEQAQGAALPDESSSEEEPEETAADKAEEKTKDVDPVPSGPPAEGIDVSNHNGKIDWQSVAASGKKFTFVLATDGQSFTSKTFDEQYNGAKQAGMMAGAYHFGRPSGSAVEQADRLMAVNKYTEDGKSLPPVLDLEVDPNSGGCYGLTSGQMHGWTQQFIDRIKEGTGQDAIVYASPSFWSQCMAGSDEFKDHPLWLASYGVDQPKVPGGWDSYDFWQYTEEGSVPGIGGDVDLNKFNGSVEKLRKLADD
ncbi:GH25 family lysozyme [Parasphingorhabdus pacifica]